MDVTPPSPFPPDPAAPAEPPTVPPGSAPVADGVDHALDPAWITASRLSSLVWVLVLGAVSLPVAVGVTFANFDLWLWIAGGWLAFVGLLGVRALVWPAVRYRHASYRVDDWGVRLRQGVFWRSVVSVPKSRVQHTDVSRGPLQRRFGIATLVIHTAGTQYAAIPVPGLPHRTALAIRDHLIDGEGEDAV